MFRTRVVAGLAAVLLVLVTMQVASGWVGVVTTRGVSMQPTYRQDDLVVTRRSGSYGVGDIIAYRSAELSEEVVLHRVIDTDADALITQGDNNDWVDRDRPTKADVVGEAWFHLPGAGRLIAPLRRLGPIVAVGAFLLVAFAFASSSPRPDQPRKRPLVTTDLRSALLHPQSTTWLVAGLVAASVLAVAGFAGSTSTRELVAQDVTHEGAFTYEADTKPSLVYPDGSVDVGDPIYRSATDSLEIRYEHQVAGPGTAVGTLSGDVVLRIGAWDHELAQMDAVDLDDGAAELTTEVDASEVEELVSEYRAISGAESPPAVVVVRPTVDASFDGAAPGAFDAELELSLGADEIAIDQEALDVSGSGSVDVPAWRVRQVELLGRSIAAAHARTVGVIGVVVAGVLLLAAALSRRRAPASAPIIAAAHGRLVPVDSLDLLDDVIDVLDAEAFARLAEGTESSLLRSVDDDGNETFVVDDGRARYRYSLRSSGRVA